MMLDERVGAHPLSLSRRLLLCCSATAVLFLGGCAVGPDFERPGAPPATALPPPPTVMEGGEGLLGEPQRVVADMDLPARWWELFRSQSLNAMIDKALAANHDLQAAEAALRVSHEAMRAGEGSFYPSVQGSFSLSRQKDATGTVSSTSQSGNPYLTQYSPQLSIAYSPDIWGGERRNQESLEAQEQAQRLQVEATYLTLTGNVVAGAISEATLNGQVEATRQMIAVESDLLDILRRQLALGQVAEGDVIAQEAALAQVEQTLPSLVKQLIQQRHALSALLGGMPADSSGETFTLTDLHLPEDLPQAVPARLVDQRPDIRMAEANLESASAQVGVAIANRFPSLTISSDVGSTAKRFSDLLKPGTGFWNVGGGLTQPLFDGFSLLHKERGARAALDQAAAQYRSTVVTAFQNVADSLTALEQDGQSMKAAVAADVAAARSLSITRKQLALGQVAYPALLTAQQTALQAKIILVQAQSARLSDAAALFQALGGGWWHRDHGQAGVAWQPGSADVVERN
jgi:NodT family efflux transporter outer membrane factor (OMF) lipoprotein